MGATSGSGKGALVVDDRAAQQGARTEVVRYEHDPEGYLPVVCVCDITHTMSRQNETKLNWLQRNLPEGLVVDAGWLEARGYSRALRSKYVARGWLDSVARGAYLRPSARLMASGEGPALHWQNVVISLQTLLERPLVVGGRTALELQGLAHYLGASGPREIHLYGDAPPPAWVGKLGLAASFVFHNAGRLFGNKLITPAEAAIGARLCDWKHDADLRQSGLICETWGHWDWPLVLSTPERAILELLDGVPQRETFHQADVLMEGLHNLSPRRLHELLVACHSVKVKRLFLWFAERHEHAWLKRLDRRGVDLGRGKRMLVRGGRLDAKFHITVPENLDAAG